MKPRYNRFQGNGGTLDQMRNLLNNMMIRGKTFLGRLHSEENGQALVEYALILALVAVVVIAAITLLGQGVHNTLNNVANAVNG